MVESLVKYYSNMIKHYDLNTYHHCQMVTNISLFIGESLSLSEDELKDLVNSSLLHDLGKIVLPIQVINKPGKLDAEEWKQIKQHPSLALSVLEYKHQKTLAPIIPGILSHHERYDGKGYPVGLAGEAIPLYGRIIAIADAFNAMTSYRIYRPKLGIKEATIEIIDKCEQQFDSYIAKATIARESELFYFLSTNRIAYQNFNKCAQSC